MILERKFAQGETSVRLEEDARIAGYASWFGVEDTGRDVVAAGAYCDSLARISAEGRRVKMLWQHDPTCVIGVWDEVREDARGLFVKGRLLPGVEKAREAASLIEAGALDGRRRCDTQDPLSAVHPFPSRSTLRCGGRSSGSPREGPGARATRLRPRALL